MRIGLISGSGAHNWPRLAEPASRQVSSHHGQVDVTAGTVAGVEVVHLSRHGTGHVRLSNHVDHLANIAALRACDVDAIISMTVCGAVDPAVGLGSVIAFDDLYFPSNRLPGGELCTWYGEPGTSGRGHWIFDRPFSEPLRLALVTSAQAAGVTVIDRGCYGHVDGPRFNSRSEIAALRAAGVTAVSQTAGPEIVLAGEAELPIAVLGFVTDHANGVSDDPQPVARLVELMDTSVETFARVVEAALPQLSTFSPAGSVYRFTQ